MSKRKKANAVNESKDKKSGGCLRPVLAGFLGFLVFTMLLSGGDRNKDESAKNTAAPSRAVSTEKVTATPKPTNTPESTAETMPKPGIKGSNAYDLTIGAEENGLAVGKRQQTSDGYSWFIDGMSSYGSYTITIDANKKYEIHRVIFAHAGNDATFFPWAVTLPFESADTNAAAAWVKACQTDDKADTFTVGDAVWTYKPHENGQHGGVLTLTVDTFDAYGLYLLDQIN